MVIPDWHRALFEQWRARRESEQMMQEDRELPPTSQPPPALDREDVQLDPVVFHEAQRQLRFRPTVDLFANAQHHQLPRYFAPREDPNAAHIDAFTADWRAETRPYCNPPWKLIAQALNKIIADEVTVLMVIPDWHLAPWYQLWERLCVRSVVYTVPVFLDAHGNLRPKPRWNTRIGVLDGKRA